MRSEFTASGLLARVAWLLMVAVVVACTLVDQPEEPGEDDPPLVPEHTEAVRMLAASPADGATNVPLNAPLWVSFDQHLRADRLIFFNTLLLRSGGLRVGVRTHYEMVDRRLVGRLTSPLEPGIVYTLAVDDGNVLGLTGAPMLESPEVVFRASANAPLVEGVESFTPTWRRDVEPIIQSLCSCHQDLFDPPWFYNLPVLSYQELVEGRSAQRNRRLVVPFQPASSYLMHKLIEDFPDRSGSVMPPPWSSTFARLPESPPQPDRDQLRLIERWIRLGAPLE